MRVSEVIKYAPRYLVLRYHSLNSYIWEALFPEDEKKRILRRIQGKQRRKEEFLSMKLLVEEASLLVFVFSIRTVFIEGANDAKKTVDILKDLDINEFYLGKERFAERNQNVIRGDLLAKELLSLFDNRAKAVITESIYMSDIVDKYKSIKNEMYA